MMFRMDMTPINTTEHTVDRQRITRELMETAFGRNIVATLETDRVGTRVMDFLDEVLQPVFMDHVVAHKISDTPVLRYLYRSTNHFNEETIYNRSAITTATAHKALSLLAISPKRDEILDQARRRHYSYTV